MTRQNQWEAFFDQHAPHYMQNTFTKNTVAEVNFLLEELQLLPGSSILDMGCGTGRHAIGLARHGYHVIGVDISSRMLAEAEKAATEAGVTVEWVHSDATKFSASKLYDAAVCLCEGAFGLLSTDEDPIEHDSAILRNISNALKPGAPFILTTLNSFAQIRKLAQEDVEQGRFDPVTMLEAADEEWDLPEGKKIVHVRERRYTPPELVALFQQTGFNVEHIWGGTAGRWGRRQLELDEVEIMVVARKLDV